MDAARHSDSSMPLVSRLDHLDFIMKQLEGKHQLPKWRGNFSIGGVADHRQSMPMDLAVKEAYFKGSLVDRVACVEHRLFQLCMELESSTTSSTSGANSSLTSGYASSGQGLPPFSLSTFNRNNNPNQGYKAESHDEHTNRLGLQEKSQRQEQGRKHSKPMKQILGKNRPSRDHEKTCNSGKKNLPLKWPRLKLLGC